MVVRERFPGLTVTTVILAYCSPRSFAQIRAPPFPMALTMRILFKAPLFCPRRLGSGKFLTLSSHTFGVGWLRKVLQEIKNELRL